MRKSIFFILVSAMALWLGFGCVPKQSGSGKPPPVVIPGGTVSPTLAIGFDATYDPALDNVVPGYKILSIAYTNNTMDLIQMDSVGDRWIVEDRKGKKVTAIINLRDKDPDTWAKLPPKLRALLEYPLLISIGTTQTLDLLFKSDVNLGEFKSVIYRVAGSKQEYRILPRGE